MKLKVTPSKLSGTVAVPGSKSHTIRGIAAGLIGKVSVLHSPLVSDDTLSALHAAEAMGAKVTVAEDCWTIKGPGKRFHNPGNTLDLGNSGTGLRMLTAMAATQDFKIAFDGDNSLRTRLMAGLLDPLSQLGAKVESTGGKCPLSVHGPIRGGRAKVDGVTSQFLTSLLFAAVTLDGDSIFELDYLNEKSYVEITLGWLDFLNIRYEVSPDFLGFKVFGGQTIGSFDKVIPADFSTACFPLVAGAVAGGEVGIRNLDFSDLQGDKKVFDFLADMGAAVTRGADLVTVCSTGKLKGGVFDLNLTPDALPIMAVAGCFAEGETRLVNVPQARFKETDRIAVMAKELGKMGADIAELPDGLVIRRSQLHGATVESHLDHRIAMSLAIAGLSAKGETLINDAEALSVTYPSFVRHFQSMGAKYDEIG